MKWTTKEEAKNLKSVMDEKLNDSILLKKQLRYQIEKDVRFFGYESDTPESLAMRYAKASQTVEEMLDYKSRRGELIDWSKENE